MLAFDSIWIAAIFYDSKPLQLQIDCYGAPWMYDKRGQERCDRSSGVWLPCSSGSSSVVTPQIDRTQGPTESPKIQSLDDTG